jgi:two-component system, NtrC family, sensor kinase
MKLTFKLVATLWAGLCALLLLSAVHSARREAELFDHDMRRDHVLIGRAVGVAFAEAWRSGGLERALDVLKEVEAREGVVSLRWLPLEPPGPGEAPPVGEGAPPGASFAGGPSAGVKAALAAGEVKAEVGGAAGGGAEGGERRLVTYVPLVAPPGPRGAVEVSESMAAEEAYVRTTMRNGLVLTAAMALFSCVASFALGSWLVGRPLSALAARARRVGEGDLSSRLRPSRRDELGDLAREVDTMCGRLEAARERVEAETKARLVALAQLRHADRLSTVGRLASGLAHELGTPLNVVQGRASLIARDAAASDAVVKGASVIVEQSERMAGIIRRLLDFARQRAEKKGRVDLRAAVAQSAAMLAPLAKKLGVALVVGPPEGEGAFALADAAQLQQVLSNLIVNAVQAMPKGGEVRVGVKVERARPPADVGGGGEQEVVRVDVEDEGVGIAPGDVERIFEPFFTTKDVGEGTGLGLSVSYGIVREHGGWIAVDSRLGAGSRFSVFLPGAP